MMAQAKQKLTSLAFLGAYLKGRRAWSKYGEKAKCPYADERTNYHEGVTFSRTFIRMWNEGYEDAKADRPVAYAPKMPKKRGPR